LSPKVGVVPATPHAVAINRGDEYVATNFSLLGLRLDPARFHDREYETVLNSMVALPLKHEAPIYEDVLVARIARAHGFQRSGDRIQRAVSKVVGRKYRKTQDDGRTVVWGENSPETVLVSYRKSNRKLGLTPTPRLLNSQVWRCHIFASGLRTTTSCTGWQITSSWAGSESRPAFAFSPPSISPDRLSLTEPCGPNGCLVTTKAFSNSSRYSPMGPSSDIRPDRGDGLCLRT
jgi:hypothetical protein